MKRILSGLVALIGLVGSADASCYLVYDGQDKVIYQGSIPPVDMSLPVSDQIRARFPGGHLVFMTEGVSCSAVEVNARPASGMHGEHTAGAVPREPQFPESEARSFFSENRPYATDYGRMSAPPGRWAAVAGTDVTVRAYFRRDGSFVPAHTRAAPRRR
jgi:hypothetical protein